MGSEDQNLLKKKRAMSHMQRKKNEFIEIPQCYFVVTNVRDKATCSGIIILHSFGRT